MNYQNLYNSLIQYRIQNPATGYTERHHILPRSMGGSDDSANLVVLTGREHWVAHLFLYKIHKTSKMAYACHMMAMRCEERGIPQVRNSRMYEHIRIECAQITSKRHAITQLGEGNSQYGTKWISNIDHKENKKIHKDDSIPDGWIEGRNKWVTKKKPIRQKLKKGIIINDGNSIMKRLYYVDQLPVPDGWIIGSLPVTQVIRDKISKTLSNKPRPYRVGLKHKKRDVVQRKNA